MPDWGYSQSFGSIIAFMAANRPHKDHGTAAALFMFSGCECFLLIGLKQRDLSQPNVALKRFQMVPAKATKNVPNISRWQRWERLARYYKGHLGVVAFGSVASFGVLAQTENHGENCGGLSFQGGRLLGYHGNRSRLDCPIWCFMFVIWRSIVSSSACLLQFEPPASLCRKSACLNIMLELRHGEREPIKVLKGSFNAQQKEWCAMRAMARAWG